MDIEQQTRLMALTACLNSVTAQANFDVAKFGEWTCNYDPHMRTYRSQIDSILGLTEPWLGPKEATNGE